MSDLTTLIEKPLAILPVSDGVPKIGNSGMTTEQALNLAVSETLKAIGKPQVSVNQTIINQVLHDNSGSQNVTLDLVNRVLQLSGVTNVGNVTIGKVLTDLKLPTGLSSYALNLSDSIGGLNNVPDTYGIYHPSGVIALVVDTVLGVTVNASSKIASHPVQGGAFASYNKVQESDKITLKVARSANGNNAKQLRKNFLEFLEKYKQGTDVYNIVTPHAVYKNMCLTAYNYRFESGGAVSMIVAELQLEEVREVKAEYTNQVAKNPDGSPAINDPQSVNAASPQSGGMANPQPPTKDERNIVQKAADWVIDKVGSIF